ncbi:YdbH domain-containing protein [Novosphingobium pokkalii]|uniref:intermembrane phospholipid transport protein YdbH family protein n=1 Tax=Novosphingobium pokkalii TaxID=1770194 RepID=UPI0036389E82
MANYAFQALRSLNYKHMTIALRGDIAGDFVTQVQFGGVSQGAGASRNFFTRQIEGLPIQFNLNVRAPFYSLLGTYKSMYDPSVVADPRTVGLLDAKGRVVPRPRPLCPPRRASPPFSLQQVEPCHEPLNALPSLDRAHRHCNDCRQQGPKEGADVRRRVLAAGMLAGPPPRFRDAFRSRRRTSRSSSS